MRHRITTYEMKQCICNIHNIVGYNDFTVVDIRDKLGITSRRISHILFKANFYGLCNIIGTKNHIYQTKRQKIYRQINKYQLKLDIDYKDIKSIRYGRF